MAISRTELRKKIMIILYQIDIYKERNLDFSVDEIIKANTEIDNEFIKDITYGVTTYADELDKEANFLMNDWTIDRLDKSGKSIIRMALYELNYTDTPEVVIINEAVNLAKEYCDDAVRKIINAILDKKIH